MTRLRYQEMGMYYYYYYYYLLTNIMVSYLLKKWMSKLKTEASNKQVWVKL